MNANLHYLSRGITTVLIGWPVACSYGLAALYYSTPSRLHCCPSLFLRVLSSALLHHLNVLLEVGLGNALLFGVSVSPVSHFMFRAIVSVRRGSSLTKPCRLTPFVHFS